jgi:hypothetical protein
MLSAPMARWTRPHAGDRTVVVAAAKLAELVRRLQQEPSYKQHIRGILVDARQQPAADSSASTFPGADYSLYDPAGHAWNPAGTGLARTWLGIPMYILTDALAAEAEERAAYNQANSFQGTLYQALMSLKMDGKVSGQAWPQQHAPAARRHTHADGRMAASPRPDAARCAAPRRPTPPIAWTRARACRWAGTACGRPCRRSTPTRPTARG